MLAWLRKHDEAGARWPAFVTIYVVFGGNAGVAMALLIALGRI